MRTPDKELGEYAHTVELPGKNWSLHTGMTIKGVFPDGGVYFGEVTYASEGDAIVMIVSHANQAIFTKGQNIRYIFNQEKA